MVESIVVGVLSLIGTLGGSIIGVLTANKLVNYRIEQLEKKVDKHNNLVERMYHLEQEVELLKRDVDSNTKEIEYIEHEQEKEG